MSEWDDDPDTTTYFHFPDGHYDETDFPPSVPPPPKTTLQLAKEYAEKAKPIVPYAVLAWGVKTRSTNTLVAAVFSLIAVKVFAKHTTITHCQFTDAGVLVK